MQSEDFSDPKISFYVTLEVGHNRMWRFVMTVKYSDGVCIEHLPCRNWTISRLTGLVFMEHHTDRILI